VSDKPGKATLYTLNTASSTALHDPLPAWSHIPSLHRRREAQLERYGFVEEVVDVVTIDETIDRFGIDVVDFMKLDVEGNELAVLQGSQRALQSKRIRALTFEFGCGNINSRT
jgi:FkbM family methyltransferase